MSEGGKLQHCEEAQRFIAQIEDPITRRLLQLAFVRFVRCTVFERTASSRSDLDMLYLMEVMNSLFAEHDVLRRTIDGETVGAWWDDADDAGQGMNSSKLDGAAVEAPTSDGRSNEAASVR